jgi:hypothetical protein
LKLSPHQKVPQFFVCDLVDDINKIDYTFIMNTTKIILEIPTSSVKKIEALVETNIKLLLETELSKQNVDVFIERMGYNNF